MTLNNNIKQTLIKTYIFRSMSESTRNLNRTVSKCGSNRNEMNESVRTLQHLAVLLLKIVGEQTV